MSSTIGPGLSGLAWRVERGLPPPRRVRAAGAATGLLLGLAFAGVGAQPLIDDRWVPPGWTIAPAILLAAGLGGWLVAPTAWRARSPDAWLGAVLAMSALSLLLGDAVVVSELLVANQSNPSTAWPWPTVVPAAALAGFEVFTLGLIVAGWFAAIFTTLEAMLWAIAMAVARRWLPTDPPAPAPTAEGSAR